MTEEFVETDPWSVTTAELYPALRENFEAGTETVVATVVGVEGSAYRRPGAKMMIAPGGDSLGAITAGCLEGPVTNLALDIIEEGESRVETFDLMDDDGEWGMGLGCRGIIDILLEPLDDSWGFALSEIEEHRQVAMVTAIESAGSVGVGDRAIVDEDGKVHTLGDHHGLPSSVVEAVTDHLERLREDANSGSFTVETEEEGTVTVFVDWLTPAPELLLFGNQNDIHPVARIGREAGFRVVVASARGARADKNQYPNAHHVRTVRAPDLADAVTDPERTYAVLMSHNLVDDRLALDSILETEIPYIGLMGPRERFEELREGLNEEGRPLTESELERIATPVGLDLGGGEPIHIALSIVGEVLAVHNDRNGGRLKNREGPIHERIEGVVD